MVEKLNEYQKLALETARYPTVLMGGDHLIGIRWVYPAMKLAGEAGEVCEKFGKIIRDKDGAINERDREAVLLELGDVLWYVAILAYELHATLEDVAQLNIDKLRSRRERGVLGGSGDDR